MNTGAEAVETAIKTARKWGYEVKGVPDGPGEDHRRGRQLPRPHDHDHQLLDRRGPRRTSGRSRPASRWCRTATPAALEAAIDEDTVAVLVEPIQGEAGVVVPPEGYLRRARELCTERGRAARSPTRSSPGSAGPGRRSPASTRASRPTCTSSARRSAAASCRCPRSWPTRACSACSSRASTAARSAATRSRARSGVASSRCCGPASSRRRRRGSATYLHSALRGGGPRDRRGGPRPRAVGRDRARRGRSHRHGRSAERLLEEGVLAKDTHESTLRLAPPLVISHEELEWGLERILPVLEGASAN